MPLPRSLARFNRVVTNRFFAPLAGRVPPWVIVEHRGRRSGRLYHTVVWAFWHGDELVFALTYGPTADWVQNVLRAQGCRVMHSGRWRTFTRADVLEGPAGLRLLPAVLRPLLDTGGVRTVLRVSGPVIAPDVVLEPVGHVESPLADRAAAPLQGDEGAPDAWLVFEPRFAEALGDLHVGEEVLLLTWLDRGRRDVLSVHPRGDPNRPPTGVFSTRSPDRPNPIGLHRVTILALEGSRVQVRNLEALDGTPILDLKPPLTQADR